MSSAASQVGFSSSERPGSAPHAMGSNSNHARGFVVSFFQSALDDGCVITLRRQRAVEVLVFELKRRI